MLDSPQKAGYQCTSKSCRSILIKSAFFLLFFIILKQKTFHFNIIRTSPPNLAVSIAVELSLFQASKSAANMIIWNIFQIFFNLEICYKMLEINLSFLCNKIFPVIFPIGKSQEFSFSFVVVVVELVAVSLQSFILGHHAVSEHVCLWAGPKNYIFPKITSLNLLTSDYIMVRWMKLVDCHSVHPLSWQGCVV